MVGDGGRWWKAIRAGAKPVPVEEDAAEDHDESDRGDRDGERALRLYAGELLVRRRRVLVRRLEAVRHTCSAVLVAAAHPVRGGDDDQEAREAQPEEHRRFARPARAADEGSRRSLVSRRHLGGLGSLMQLNHS